MSNENLLNSNSRVRSLRAVYYGDMENCLAVLQSQCNHYACILHDKDLDEDGNLKKPHIHIIARFGQPKTVNAFLKAFDEQLAQKCMPCLDGALVNYWEYLTHKNNPDKAQYQEQDIQCDNIVYWQRELSNKGVSNEKKDVSFDILMDIVQNKPYKYLFQTYGRDLIIHWESYRQCAKLLAQELDYYQVEEANQDFIQSIQNNELEELDKC